MQRAYKVGSLVGPTLIFEAHRVYCDDKKKGESPAPADASFYVAHGGAFTASSAAGFGQLASTLAIRIAWRCTQRVFCLITP